MLSTKGIVEETIPTAAAAEVAHSSRRRIAKSASDTSAKRRPVLPSDGGEAVDAGITI
jgi:hypothetical protein